MSKKNKPTLDRRAVVNKILKPRADALVVTGLGSSCYDVGAAGDHPHNFYLWGGMGAAAMLGLGLALAQPTRQVLVITGDGEMLMGLGALATIGSQGPSNLSIVVIDNELYSETGMQPTHTSRGVDLAGMAKAANFARTDTIYTMQQLAAWVPKLYTPAGPAFVAIKVNSARYPLSIRLRDGAHIKNRFREALLGNAAFN
jgi:thiamine pyrophosphate-dependent acetolactate synthase large subunit-like protein